MIGDVEWFTSVSIFTVAIVASPGPNNGMVMASGANFGLVRTLPHIIGICIGVPVMYIIIALFGQPILANGTFRTVLRIVGILYLLYLALRLAITRPKKPKTETSELVVSKPLTLWQAAAFQWINPQVWLTAGGALASYTFANGSSSMPGSFLLAMIFGLVALPCVTLWTLLGVGASRIMRQERSFIIFNRVMATLLVASLIPVIFHK